MVLKRLARVSGRVGKFEGENFARERQTASACPSGQNAETKFSSTFLILLATIFFFT